MKRRRSPLFVLIVILAFVASGVLIRYRLSWGLAGVGALSIIVAVNVERQSGRIWKSYRRNYQPGKNRLLNRLNEPRPIYKLINVYLVWPAVFGLGVYAIYMAWHLK